MRCFLKSLYTDSMTHIKNNNMSYMTHFFVSQKLSFIFLKGCIQGLLHCIIPGVFSDFTESTCNQIKNNKLDLQIKYLENKKDY